MEKLDINDYISFVSKDNIIVYTEKNNIIENAPVIANILNLNNIYNDKPIMKNNSYTFFEELESKSIIFIFKFISLQLEKYDKIDDQSKSNSVLYDISDYVKGMKYHHFYEARDFCEPMCVFIPNNFWKLLNKVPMNRNEDIYNEYQFIDIVFNPCDYTTNEKNIHEIIEKTYLKNNWKIVEQQLLVTQQRYGHEVYQHDVPRTYKLTLRKKLNIYSS